MDKLISFLKEMGKTFGLFLIYLFGEIFVYSIFINFNINIPKIYIRVIGSIVTLVVICILLRKDLNKNIKSFKKEYILKAIKYWLIGFIIMILSNAIINNFIIVDGMSTNETLNREFMTNYKVYSAISICIFAPIVEELIFRLSIRKAIKNDKIFIIVSSLLFAGMHVISAINNPLELFYLIPYGALGIAFAKSYIDTSNIFTSISAHMIHNILSFIVIMASL